MVQKLSPTAELNMVYVDDLSVEGASLVASQARLVIIGSDQTQEVVLNTNGGNEESKR